MTREADAVEADEAESKEISWGEEVEGSMYPVSRLGSLWTKKPDALLHTKPSISSSKYGRTPSNSCISAIGEEVASARLPVGRD